MISGNYWIIKPKEESLGEEYVVVRKNCDLLSGVKYQVKDPSIEIVKPIVWRVSEAGN